MEPVWTMPALRFPWGLSKTLVSNKCPPLTYVPLDSLPSHQVFLGRRTKGIPDSDQNGLTLRTRRSVVQRLVTVADQTMRWSLEHLAAVEANKCCCQLPFHARNVA